MSIVLVELKCRTVLHGHTFRPGDQVAMASFISDRFIERGRAVVLDDDYKRPPRTEKPEPESGTPRGRRRKAKPKPDDTLY